MELDRKQLEGQLESLDAQRRHAERTLAEIAGAERMCRHLLGLMDREEDARKASAVPAAD